MLTQAYRILMPFFLISSYLCSIGCGSSEDDYVEPDTEPPAIPRGVESITGNGQVTIEWFPNGESDLAGYTIWRSLDNETFNLLESVSADEFQYIDRDVRNGTIYYYAVSALDLEGNESDLSPENIFDTPRPSGNNVTLNRFTILPEQSGFDFSQPEKGAIPWDSPTTDVYFGPTEIFSEFDVSYAVPYLYSGNLTEMQDMGYHEAFDEVNVSPFLGFTTEFVELIEGHVYIFYTPDRNYAKIHVVAISDNAVTFDWAYQIDPDNPELAPPLHH